MNDELIARIAWLDDALTAERALADAAADILDTARPAGAVSYISTAAVEQWQARHRKARGLPDGGSHPYEAQAQWSGTCAVCGQGEGSGVHDGCREAREL